MKYKRMISLLLIFVMALGLLSGCGESKTIVSIDDPAAITPNPHILTPELLEKAAGNPVVTAEDHPRWTGFVLNYTASPGEFATSPTGDRTLLEMGV